MLSDQLLQLAQEVNALSEIGLVYQKDDFDRERYERLKRISIEMLSLLIDQPVAAIEGAMQPTGKYITPMVDVRAVVFNEKDELLLVKERVDGRWSMPGGWADVGYTPSEIAVKETAEEAGVAVEGKRLLAVMDKKCHNHPADVHYVYKIYIACKILHCDLDRGHETDDVRFFTINDLPLLSLPRNTKDQIDILYDLYKNPEKPVYFD